MAYVYEKKEVPENCSTCLYLRAIGVGCAHADRQKDHLRYVLFGNCPSWWLDHRRFESAKVVEQ